MLKGATWSVCWIIIHHFQCLGDILRQKHKQKKCKEASSNESSFWHLWTLGNWVCSFLWGGIYLPTMWLASINMNLKDTKLFTSFIAPTRIRSKKYLFGKWHPEISKYWKWKNPLLDPKQVILKIVSLHTGCLFYISYLIWPNLFTIRPGSYLIFLSKANCRALCYHIIYSCARFQLGLMHINLLWKENNSKSLPSHCMSNALYLQFQQTFLKHLANLPPLSVTTFAFI